MQEFYSQFQTSYLFDGKFHRLYVRYGPGKVIGHPSLPSYIKVTRSQLERDKIHLYGIIQQSTRKSNIAEKFIHQYQDDKDGLRVWIDLDASQDQNGSIEVREARIGDIIQLSAISYTGDLAKYVEDIEDAFSRLQALGNKYTSRQKFQCLFDNLQESEVDDYLVSHCRDNFTRFEDCVSYLRKEAVGREDFAMENDSGQDNINTMQQSVNVPDDWDDESFGSADQEDAAMVKYTAMDGNWLIPLLEIF